MDGLVHRPVPGLPAGWFRLLSTARLLGPSITNYTSMTKVQVQNSNVYEMASSVGATFLTNRSSEA
jgi:hypothetical protein